MRFATPTRRRPTENIVPMINVVFLLLVFFLMTATIAPPAPLDVTPPAAEASEKTTAAAVLHVAADGALAFGTEKGEAALTSAAAQGAPVLTLRADAGLDGVALAQLLARLAAAGVAQVELVTVARGGGAP